MYQHSPKESTEFKTVILDASTVPQRVWDGIRFLLSELPNLRDGLFISRADVNNEAIKVAVLLGLVDVFRTLDGHYLIRLPGKVAV